MVHLLPLPGSPRFTGDMDQVVTRAVTDALAIAQGGADALIIENYGDAPFLPGFVRSETVAAMTLAAHEIKKEIRIPAGINMLRNDAMAGIAVATVLGCDFIRVNVHTGVVATDQGIIQGKAFETLRYRESLNSPVLIFADVFVKHGRTLNTENIVSAASDTVERGLADGMILTGEATGAETDPEALRLVKASLPDVPVLAGSGVHKDNIKDRLPYCDGVIAGTCIKQEEEIQNPVDIKRVRALVEQRNLFLSQEPPV